MTIAVLGGAGYIGSHTVKQLLADGEDVIVLDNLITGHRKAVDPRARFYQGDIRDYHFLSQVFSQEKIDGIVHFAAFSIVPESMKDPLKYFDNNTGGMITLLEAMNQFGIKKIVFSSTAATYGEPKQVPIKETDPQVPTNPYGESKLAMEKIMHWADIAYGLKFVALRYFNVAGAMPDGSIGEDHHPETHLIPIILQVAAGTRTGLQIYGDDYPTKDGTNVRDYVHVVDLADAHVLALNMAFQTWKFSMLRVKLPAKRFRQRWARGVPVILALWLPVQRKPAIFWDGSQTTMISTKLSKRRGSGMRIIRKASVTVIDRN